MKSLLAAALSVCLFAAPCLAQGNGFRAQYKGGTFSAQGDDGRLFVTADGIQLAMKQGERLDIVPQNVTGLSYGTEASRRVALWVTLGIVLTPIALFGLFAKRTNHYIGIEYKGADGKPGAVMIRADKKEYMPLASLRSVTGKKVVGLDDRHRKGDDWTKMSDEK
ncbi:MAG: hypothetical protein H0U18_07235 [Pyrinomonadaceae bacterium]|jgi:hypothetical protein|nr:hypothetical protein [Pyrinomonadaceae bacterium]